MKNYKGPGENVTRVAPYDVVTGGGLQVGQLFGVAVNDALNTKPVVMSTTGTYELVKLAAQAWTVGQLIYWDNVNKRCTNATATGLLLIGSAEEVAANPSATGIVRLNGAAAAAQP